MEKISNWIEKKISPLANKLARQKYLQALQNTFLALIPLFTIGSFALIIISPPMDYTTMDSGVLKAIMHGWANVAAFTGPALGYVYSVTMSLIALWSSIGLAINLSKHYKMEKSWVTIAVSVASFMIAATMNKDGALSFDYLDGKGLFTAILVTIVSFELYRFLSDRKIGYINLEGGGVPPALAESIGNLVPIVIVLVAVGTVNAILLNFTGAGIPAIMQLIMTPVVKMVDSVWELLY